MGALASVVDATEIGQATARSIAPNAIISDNFEAILVDDQIQGVALATPAETHAELAIQAMRAGKDVFVEKPMALSIRDAEAMQTVANETGRILMVGHLLEYHPAVLKLRELINSGELGKINYVYSNRLNFGKVRTEENALWSFAPHDVAVILRLWANHPLRYLQVAVPTLTKTFLMSQFRIFDLRIIREHIFLLVGCIPTRSNDWLSLVTKKWQYLTM